MPRTFPEAIRELCLSMPGSEEVRQHGVPNFKVGGKSFAMFCVNHHGDGRVALWLNSPQGTQQLYVQLDPESYFVPPYVGPRGWLGVKLNSGLSWREVRARVAEAWENASPRAVNTDELPQVAAPDVEMLPEDIDPLLGVRAREVLEKLTALCGRFPESITVDELGSPAWKAGRKIYVRSCHIDGRLNLMFRVGVEQQPFFNEDTRYTIPPYYGSSGWIALDVQEHDNWEEIGSLLETSYRQVALKRMLNALEEKRKKSGVRAKCQSNCSGPNNIP